MAHPKLKPLFAPPCIVCLLLPLKSLVPSFHPSYGFITNHQLSRWNGQHVWTPPDVPQGVFGLVQRPRGRWVIEKDGIPIVLAKHHQLPQMFIHFVCIIFCFGVSLQVNFTSNSSRGLQKLQKMAAACFEKHHPNLKLGSLSFQTKNTQKDIHKFTENPCRSNKL